jgi:hypothetical protein
MLFRMAIHCSFSMGLSVSSLVHLETSTYMDGVLGTFSHHRANICEGYGDIRLIPNRANTWRMIRMISLKAAAQYLGGYWILQGAYYKPSVARR